VHWLLTSPRGDADAHAVRWIPTHARERASLLRAPVIVAGCLALLVFVPTAIGSSEDLSDLDPVAGVAPADLGDVSGGASLLPEDDAAADDGFATVEEEPGLVDEAPTGSVRSLEAKRDSLRRERDVLQAQLLRLEANRGAAEDRLAAAEQAYADHLVALYDEDALDRVQLLIELRDSEDELRRGEIVAGLTAADSVVVDAQEAARTAVATATTRADAVREQLRELATRISAYDTAIDGRSKRRKADTFSVDADLIFTTGPIPGIGYWGAMNDGSLLSGWMGMAGAQLGGIGCESPDPTLRATGTIETGEASWYGPGFDGQQTANGETYDQTAMTAAHRTLPFGTIVRVYSNATARCAFVRITDRGPFVDGRIIDLSKAAADAIGMDGTAPVQLEVWAGDQ